LPLRRLSASLLLAVVVEALFTLEAAAVVGI
jgi:hypothetical protein